MADDKGTPSDPRDAAADSVVDPEVFRDALAHWASGVAVAAVRDPDADRIYATTVTSFMSVSLEPPLVALGLGASAQVLPFLTQEASFGISILAEAQKRLASVFADSFPIGPSPFDSEPALGGNRSNEPESTRESAWAGAPTITDALYVLSCAVRESIQAGDHLLVLARVLDARAGPDAGPLIRYRRSYRSLGSD